MKNKTLWIKGNKSETFFLYFKGQNNEIISLQKGAFGRYWFMDSNKS